MKVIPVKDPVTGEIEEIIPYSEYADDLEVGVVFNRIDTYMGDLDEDDRHMRVRIAGTFVTVILSLLGIYLILLGGAMTVAFQSQPRLIWLQCIGAVCEIPILLWGVFICCPSKEERRRRRVLRSKRKMRKEMYADKDEAKFISMANENIKARVEQEVGDKRTKAEREIAEKKANPLGYPKPEKKTSERKTSERGTSERNTSERKTSERKTSERKTSERKTSERKF
jgi:hypothetical protein